MLTIKGIDKKVGEGVMWGWDLERMEEEGTTYVFFFKERSGDGRVVASLDRRLTPNGSPNPKFREGYELFTFCDRGGWQSKKWLRLEELRKDKVFWLTVEGIILDNTPLPF